MFNAHGANALVELIPAQAATSTVTGSAVDVQDYRGKVKVILATSIGGGTTPTLNVKLQDSADGSTGWADISGATFTEVTDSADATESIGVVLDSSKRYIRAVGTIAGTSPTYSFAVVMVGATNPVSA